MIQNAFDGRYVVLLMSIFSMLCGTLYNEVFGIPVDYFHSRWDLPWEQWHRRPTYTDGDRYLRNCSGFSQLHAATTGTVSVGRRSSLEVVI